MPTTPDPRPDRRAAHRTDQPRAVLFGRAGCHLCDAARAVLQAECEAAGVAWAEVDVDRAAGADGRPLADDYGELVPVVEVDGVRVGYWQIDPVRLREALHVRLP
ncbi:MAG TPA: glutaredoxin family protein [Cellulomonas sp.]